MRYLDKETFCKVNGLTLRYLLKTHVKVLMSLPFYRNSLDLNSQNEQNEKGTFCNCCKLELI